MALDDDKLIFEIRIHFAGDEGDEAAVLDMMAPLKAEIEEQTLVKVKDVEMYVFDRRSCHHQGRGHATRYQSW